MPAPTKVHELIKRFEDNYESYHSQKYNETQARREFIDPLFKALGWDVDNEQGNAEAYKDVIHEDAVKVEGKSKAPDYSFRVGGTRKFFLEAKKPSVNIKDDPAPAFQLRRYGWSAKLPISILTDFEELAIYDCRIKPELGDKASTARIKYYKYDEFIEKWDEIEAIFSKKAVIEGSFDKYAGDAKTKRGTSEVDDAFLKEIESWRELLAKNIALRNPTLTQRELNTAVQKTIDRIIFLRICEDRQIEPYGVLKEISAGKDLYSRLGNLFHRADDRYNSGLFHFKKEKNRSEEPDIFTLGLEIDDEPLKDILDGLYYPTSPYEFSVLPADILGQVYEQFLGKVIILDNNHKATVEEKPEIKKAGGVYYTPTYIVDYIIENTLGRLLEGKTPDQILGLSKTPPIRVLDPACGSGSFLIGAYQYLLDWYLSWYVKNDIEKYSKGKKAVIYKKKGITWSLTTDERKRILLTHIYGVDIDAQAVEVTKLSLLLKTLEGENNDTLKMQELFQSRILPDLEDNIKSGNSLVGSDFYDLQQTSLFDDEDRYRVNAFDWHIEFQQALSNGGFDIVIGNPPYGATLYNEEKKYLKLTYKNQNYQLESYLIFLEQSLSKLLKPKGYYGMIIPNPWLTNLLQTSLRKYIFSNSSIEEIIHFKYPVFKKATVDTQIVILRNEVKDPHNAKVYVVPHKPSNLSSVCKNAIIQRQERWIQLEGEPVNIFLTEASIDLASKLKTLGTELGKLFKINVGIKPYQVGKGVPAQTKNTVDERKFDSDVKIDATYRPYLRGGDILHYAINPIEVKFLKYGKWLAEPRPAADFDSPVKILMRQTGDSLIAAIDTEQYICLNNVHVLVPSNPDIDSYYVLGVINSRLMNWYYQTLNPEIGEAFAEVKKANVAKLPVRILSKNNQKSEACIQVTDNTLKQIEVLDKLRNTKLDHDRKILSRQIETLIKQRDKLVYEIYDLSAQEILLIESETHET